MYAVRLWLGVAAILGATASDAQPWKPTRPVAFITPAAPAGSMDLTARLIQRVWDDARAIGVPVVVINKPGAGNGLALSYLNEHDDGHAIAVGSTNLMSNPVTGLHTISHRDVTPLALLFDDHYVLAVRADSPLKTMADLRDRLRVDAGALSVGFGPGIGAGGHTAAAVAWKAMGVDVRKARFVPYKSGGDAIVAVLAGELDVACGSASNLPAFLAAGRVRAVALLATQRLTGPLAVAPTMKEQGFDAVFTTWRGVVGPKGMRRQHVAFWENALAVVNESALWKKELERSYWRANFVTGPKLREFMDAEALRYRVLLTELGLGK